MNETYFLYVVGLFFREGGKIPLLVKKRELFITFSVLVWHRRNSDIFSVVVCLDENSNILN